MIYHLTRWDDVKQKWEKKPVGLQGEPLMSGGGIATSSDRAAVEAMVARLGDSYRLGLWITSGMFFLDLDEDAVAGGSLTPSATEFASELVAAGCYFEASTSGRGAHVIGRYSGELPPHMIQRPLGEPSPHALYTSGRGCVLSNVHAGSWDVDATIPLLRLLDRFFKPRVSATQLHALTAGPRPEWRGPADDDELIRRFLSATGSQLSRLRGAVPLADLWAGRCEHNNESDFGLAAHLAFWTGCDVDRIERLMRRSPMAAHRIDKWDTHSTYLRELTITKAVVTTSTVYVEPQRVDTAASILGVSLRPLTLAAPLTPLAQPAADWHAVAENAITAINSAGTFKELTDNVMPTLGALGLPRLHGERVVTALTKKLEIFDAKMPVGQLRALVMPPLIADALTATVPEWATSILYVLASDKFYDSSTGSLYTHTGFKMQFQRLMPMRSTGVREDPAQFLMDRWNIEVVDDLQYRPDQPRTFEYAGHTYGNTFRASTVPTPVVGSAECSACIQLFLEHLAAVVNRRENLYRLLLQWIAHNVQKPGVKILWSPLIKGVQGDGKSIFGKLLRSTMGAANVKITSSSSVANKGGFTDWANGKAVNIIEEIKLEGKEARAMYNNMKTLIGDNQIDLNRKGQASGDNLENVMNHWANTQHADAVPVEKGERRWLVIFTPWNSADEAARLKGLESADSLPAYFERIGSSMTAEPGAWRSWLLGIDLSSFNANGRAAWTAERDAMMTGSEDFVEQSVRDVIEQGGTGITIDVFCSASLMGRVNVAMGEKPDSRTWNKILTHLGYQQISRLEWLGRTRRIWAKKSMTNPEIVAILNRTADLSGSVVRL